MLPFLPPPLPPLASSQLAPPRAPSLPQHSASCAIRAAIVRRLSSRTCYPPPLSPPVCVFTHARAWDTHDFCRDPKNRRLLIVFDAFFVYAKVFPALRGREDENPRITKKFPTRNQWCVVLKKQQKKFKIFPKFQHSKLNQI